MKDSKVLKIMPIHNTLFIDLKHQLLKTLSLSWGYTTFDLLFD